MTETLAEKACEPHGGGVAPLKHDEAQRFQEQSPDWKLSEGALRIPRTFRFHNFGEASAIVWEVGELAETEGHHPDISFGRGYVTFFPRTPVRPLDLGAHKICESDVQATQFTSLGLVWARRLRSIAAPSYVGHGSRSRCKTPIAPPARYRESGRRL
jgi:4a-hydroxytetrahydrobiopterin dehydratase